MTYQTIAPRAINKVVILWFPEGVGCWGQGLWQVVLAELPDSREFREIASGGESASEPYTNAIAGDR